MTSGLPFMGVLLMNQCAHGALSENPVV